MKPVVLGVAGGTGSGKTTVVRAMLDAVGDGRIAFLEQDNYYRDLAWESAEQLQSYNFDHPQALESSLLVEHVAALKRGEPIEAPIYDFVIHRRKAETRPIEPRPVVLVEGILIFADKALRDLLDFKIYVDTDADLRLTRRLKRDLSERGRSLDDVLRQYEQSVRPMHLEFVEPSKRWADVIVPEGGENRVGPRYDRGAGRAAALPFGGLTLAFDSRLSPAAAARPSPLSPNADPPEDRLVSASRTGWPLLAVGLLALAALGLAFAVRPHTGQPFSAGRHSGQRARPSRLDPRAQRERPRHRGRHRLRQAGRLVERPPLVGRGGAVRAGRDPGGEAPGAQGGAHPARGARSRLSGEPVPLARE